jgi:hypothetical protein
MLIQKLKQYPKVSQGTSYATTPQAATPSTIQTAVLGQFTLSTTGADYVGPYHTMANGDYMTGATHDRGSVQLIPITSGNQSTVVGTALVGRSNTNTPATSNSTQNQPYVPSLAELSEYEKYRVSGSLYKSNISYVNSRDNKGNISLRENENNELLVIENISNNFTNRSIVSAIDTQFRYFKFPATISTTVDDIEFDDSLLDIDIQNAISNDPFAGRLVVSAGGSDKFYIQAGKKRKFFIKADSTWALKNGLPPFANIAGTINGKDNGEDNYFSTDSNGNNTGYNEETVVTIPVSVFDGYEIGDDYTPEDAFLEGNAYGKISFTTDGTANNIPANKYLNINGPNFGFISFNGISETLGQFRFAEFAVDEFSTSYIGIGVDNFNNTTSDLGNYNIGADNDPFGPYRSIYSNAFNLTAESLLNELINGNTAVTAIGEKLKFDTTTGTSPQEYIPINSTVLKKNITGGSASTYKIANLASPFDTYYVGLNGESLSTTNGPKYIWYKLTLNLTRTGTKYRLLHDGTNISFELRDRNGNKNNGSSVDLLCPEKAGDPYRGWTLNIADVFPNGFVPNTSEKFKIEFLNNQSTSFDLDIYFIGWGTQNTAGTITDYNIVQGSVRFDIPDLTDLQMPSGPS